MDELINMDIEVDFEFYKAYLLFFKEKIDFDNPDFKNRMNSMIHLLNEFGLYRDRYLVKDIKDGIPYSQRLNRICYHMRSRFKTFSEEQLRFLDELEVSYPSLDEELISKLGDILADVSGNSDIDKYYLIADTSQKLMSNDREYTIDILLNTIGIDKYDNLDDLKTQIKSYQRKKTEEEVNSSDEFHDACNKYGLNFLNFSLVDNYVVVRTFHDNLCVIMNENYDIINITKLDEKNLKNQVEESFAELNSYDLKYPFDNLNLDDIVRIGNSNIESNCELDTEILSYIRFMSIEASIYQRNMLAVQSVGLELPLITKYLHSVQNNMEEYINCRKGISMPTESNDILEFLGQKYETSIDCNDIENIIKFIYSEHDENEVEKCVQKLRVKSFKQKVKTI